MAVVLGLMVPAAAAANVAPCEKAMAGSGRADWRKGSVTAGPVGVVKHPLAHMSQTKRGLVAKMPLLVAGHRPVTVRVPPRLKARVFLYYGRIRDRHGHPTTSFFDARGYGETRFEPCRGKPRTVWPGGVRVRGRAPVHLTVLVEGSPPRQLRLGRPRVNR